MKIGVIGSGNVGGTLDARWAQAGHEVIFSSRNPDSNEMKDLLARAGSSARGPLTQARLLEPFALLWISLAYEAGQGRDIAFKLLRRSCLRRTARFSRRAHSLRRARIERT